MFRFSVSTHLDLLSNALPFAFSEQKIEKQARANHEQELCLREGVN